MEGLIPFVIDAIRKSHERSGYRCLPSDGSSHGGGRQLIDYRELPGAASAMGEDSARTDLICPDDGYPSCREARPAGRGSSRVRLSPEMKDGMVVAAAFEA